MNTAKNCRICGNEISPFMTFGQMPIANGFLKEHEFSKEYFFEMKPSFCKNCFAFQLIDQPDASMMFNENYPFFSSLSKHMQLHFEKFAESLIDNFIKDKSNSFVIELGSNDGIMLKHFKNRGIKHLGVEPSSNVAEISANEGINTISEFFDEDLADKILDEYGNANIIYAANVMCHIPDLNSVFRGISKLLGSNGVLVFEDPYLGEMLKKVSYDQIYDEHVYIFSASSVSSLCERHGLELIDAKSQKTHGGSMRYFIAPKGSHKITKDITDLIEDENNKGFKSESIYLSFKRDCENSKKDLIAKEISKAVNIEPQIDNGDILPSDNTGKSISNSISFFFDNGDQIMIDCSDWSDAVTFLDNLKVVLLPRYVNRWILDEAHK